MQLNGEICAGEETEIVRVNREDYIDKETGLLYCGKCHTPKQCKVVFAGIERHPGCLCFCELEKKQADDERELKRKFADMVQGYRLEAFSEQWMARWTFEFDDGSNPQMTRIARNYVDNFQTLKKEGKGLLLCGNTGIGKTFAACEIVNALIDKGIRCYVTNFARVLNTLQGTFDKQPFIDGLSKYELLVVDDLGIERTTEFAQEQVYNIIDSRYRSGLPMIITTNLSLQELKKPTSYSDKRIYDRVLERCFPVEVDGNSHRRKNICDDYEKTKQILFK